MNNLRVFRVGDKISLYSQEKAARLIYIFGAAP